MMKIFKVTVEQHGISKVKKLYASNPKTTMDNIEQWIKKFYPKVKILKIEEVQQ